MSRNKKRQRASRQEISHQRTNATIFAASLENTATINTSCNIQIGRAVEESKALGRKNLIVSQIPGTNHGSGTCQKKTKLTVANTV